MLKRRLWVVLGLLAAATEARADWQPEPPPIPPETEDAQRNRSEPAARSGEPAPQRSTARVEAPARTGEPAPQHSTAPASAPAARSSGAAPSGNDASQRGATLGEAAASSSATAQSPSGRVSVATSPTPAAQVRAADQPTATPPPGGAPPPAAPVAPRAPVDPSARTDADAMRAFPPAPAPAAPGAAPEKPTTALTSFAPAPAPGSQSAQSSGPAGAQQAASSDTSARSAPSGSVGAAASGSDDARTGAPSGPAALSSGASVQTTPGDGTGAAGSSSASELAAEGGEERAQETWSAAALFGVGATFDKTVAGVNPMGFGFGVRADYRILPDWAIGARMLYFVGGSVELPSDDVAMQSWLLAAEAAYALELDPVSIEPGLALGLYVRETNYRGYASFTDTDTPTVSVPDSTRLFFYLAPGVNVSVPLSVASPALAPLSVGADVRLDLAFGKRVTSNIQLLLQVGLRF